MNSTVINIKTDVKVKKKKRKRSPPIGFELKRGAINGFLRQLIRDKKINFQLWMRAKPAKYLKSAIKRSEDDIKNGRVYSFKNNREAIDFLADK